MNSTFSIKGIIYRIYNSSNADKIINIIDDKGRRVDLLCKGVRKFNSKKGFSIDIGNYVDAKVVEGYSISVLTEINLLNEFKSWKTDFNGLILIQFILEVISHFCYEENHDATLFEILYNTLSNENIRKLYLVSIFLLKILDVGGYLPQLNECATTSEQLEEDDIYSTNEIVGYISEKEIGKFSNIEKVPGRIAKTQKYLLENTIDNSLKIDLKQEEIRQLFRIELGWIENVIGKPLKSKKMLSYIK